MPVIIGEDKKLLIHAMYNAFYLHSNFIITPDIEEECSEECEV